MSEVPLEIREWIRTIALSVPNAVKLYIVGSCPLSIYTKTFNYNNIDVFVTGLEYIKDKLKWKTSTNEHGDDLRQLNFYGKTSSILDEWYHINENQSRILNTKNILFTDFLVNEIQVNFYFVNDMSLNDIFASFDYDILHISIADVHDINWEIKTTNFAKQALEKKQICIKETKETFFHKNKHYIEARLKKYKERFPAFTFEAQTLESSSDLYDMCN